VRPTALKANGIAAKNRPLNGLQIQQDFANYRNKLVKQDKLSRRKIKVFGNKKTADKEAKKVELMTDSFTDTDNNTHKIRIGDKVRDVVTGAEGVVISYTKHLTGCDTVTLELGVTPEGKTPLLGLDVTRLEVIQAGVFSKEKLPGFQNPYKDTFSGKAVPAAG
jgi:hypothetical protein